MNHATHSHLRSTRASHRDGAFRRGERGLTLLELMISVVVGSMLVGFVFDIHGRMSTAFRAQNNIGSLQQGIRAANELIARDIRQAGFMMPDGAFVSSNFNPATSPVVQIAGGNRFVPGFSVFNNPEGRGDDQMQPDRVHVFYADPDPNHQTVVVGDVTPTSVGVITSSIFLPGELALLVTQDPVPRPHPLGGNMPPVSRYYACVVEVTNSSGGTSANGHDELFFEPSLYNTVANEHCFIPTQTAIVDPTTPGVVGRTQVFRLIARAYRIDVTRELASPLEIDVTGGLLNEWVLMGIGFVDLQITQRFVEEVSDLVDPDNDGNPRMDWYSAGGPFPLNSHLTQVGIGLVARTARQVEGVRATQIPVLYDLDNNPPRNHNPLGDAVGPKLLTNPEFSGDHVYRQSYMSVDMRNIGVAF